MSQTLWTDEQEKPLRHIHVIDASIMLPGAYLTGILAQYGAEVVKIEHPPKGDPLREVKDSCIFNALNRGKRSVAVDLKSNDGQLLVKQLVAEADVFVENFRDGLMDQMNLGYAELSEINPDLLYFSIRGFGGKHGKQAGHDLNFIATSGCGEWFLGDTPNFSTRFADVVGGTHVPLIRLLMHLANPHRRGMHLITKMDDGFRSLYLPRAYEAFHKMAGIHAHLDGTKAHSRFYLCRDDQWISLNAIQKKHWDIFCDTVDKKEWKERHEDPNLVKDLEALFQDAPASYWESLTNNQDACLFRVIPWEEHIQNTQTQIDLQSDPLHWAGFSPNRTLPKAPKVGEDTYAVFQSYGLTPAEISTLMKNGTLFQP